MIMCEINSVGSSSRGNIFYTTYISKLQPPPGHLQSCTQSSAETFLYLSSSSTSELHDPRRADDGSSLASALEIDANKAKAVKAMNFMLELFD